MKTERRAEAKVRRQEAPARPTDFDPDIAGMVPGPQAMPTGSASSSKRSSAPREAAEKAAREGR